MIPFNKLPEEIVEVLKNEGITENDLYNYQSDLYVGCTSIEQALNILNGGKWRAFSSTFKPNQGSDMEEYPIGLDIGLGAIEYFAQQQANHRKRYRHSML